MTKELIERLYASDVASALTNEAARAIEALQARVADQSAQLTRHTNLIDHLQEERCKLAAELAAARAQEPVSYRYKFTHPISGEPVWRDSSPMWNGQCVQEVQPLFAAPVPPVREPLSYRDILRIYNEVGQEDGAPYRFAGAIEAAIAQPATTEWTVIAPDGTRFTGPTPLKAALPASKYRLEIDPVAAVKFMEIIDQEAEKGRQEAEQCMRDYGTLDCPACGGSGHIGDVKQPAQVPAGSIRLWDTQWVSIVNHDNAYNGWSTNDAVNHAVRMTERYIAANVAQNNLPPLPAAPEVKP